MWRRIWYIVATFLVALLLSVVNRGVFILYNIELFDEYSLLELAKAFYYGLQLDCTIAGYITALPLIVSIATLWLSDKWRNHKAWQRVHCAYFAIITFLVSAIEVADIGMFGAWLSRIDAQVLIYSPTEMLSSLTLGNILGVVCYVGITTAVATWLYMRGVKRWFLRQLDDRLTTAKRSGYTTTLVIFGSRSIVVEGAHICREAVLGSNTVITGSTHIIDVTGDEPVEYKGYVPPRSVVVSGTYTKHFPAGDYGVQCALIIGRRKESTDKKTSLNDALRDYSIS